MTRVLSGIQPSGVLHLGNYLGAIRQWVADEQSFDSFYCVVDLHALTLTIDPDELRSNSIQTAIVMFAAGLSPERSTIFLQSHVPAHTRIAWLLECTATMGELRRMTQFKDKGQGQESVRAGLFTYPVLMAADIVAYQADRIPVGDDQRQHLELARTLAIRFNTTYGETFTVPQGFTPKAGARVMDLQHPTQKMSKSLKSPQGTINLTDTPDEIDKKVRRAVTDTLNEVVYEPAERPGVSNLLDLLCAATGDDPKTAAEKFTNYGGLKAAVSEALIEMLRPMQEAMTSLSSDPGAIATALRQGAEKANAVADPTADKAMAAMGLLPKN